MREDLGLFKGKRKVDEGWVYGYVYSIILTIPNVHLGYVIRGSRPGQFSFAANEVYEDTICEYTGLTDKNKVKIFEGDIVESRASESPEDWKRWVVVWNDGGFEFTREVSHRKKHKHEANTLCSDEIELYGLVVVGNIFDSPKLLEGGAENE